MNGQDGVSRETHGTVMSMEDIKLGLSDMARNGEGAQRAQAYRMLMNMESATVVLPPPLSYDEEIERLTRMIKAAGREKSQSAFHRAFPRDKAQIDDGDELSIHDMPPHIRFTSEHVTTLPKLYKMEPSIKPNGGQPSGYPKGRGKALQCKWCQHQAALILLERWRKDGGEEPPRET
jgi:hypothetical protein